jgi:hypothetical protein
MQNISRDGEKPQYKKVSECSLILPTFLDTTNTKYSWRDVLDAWGFEHMVEPQDGEKAKKMDLREVFSMPKGWRTDVMAFSDLCVIFDKKKRPRGRFHFSDLKSPLQVVPAISTFVDYDTHVLGNFAAPPRGLVGVVKLGGKIVYSTQRTPYRMRTTQWGNETEESAKERETVTAHLKSLCAKYIELHYPDADAMAYWD